MTDTDWVWGVSYTSCPCLKTSSFDFRSKTSILTLLLALLYAAKLPMDPKEYNIPTSVSFGTMEDVLFLFSFLESRFTKYQWSIFDRLTNNNKKKRRRIEGVAARSRCYNE